ncbi:C25 family cysteine peptidase [Segetibacter sp. 3557_3]|uniref:putative type IX secretion system sortase PorU2 n=1 Tax=Segetibacter sp. 3557_3 TaxID=2547429 RepID=UPI001404DA60|nr:C25 family cysteine peptidase [Segetibacter sp. 3557_3]
MKKLFVLFSLFMLAGLSFGQTFNNEWIDYTKTYYKFRLSTTGLYRISASALTSAGLGAQPAENFQLWRNGRQVPLFTSAASGPLGSTGYIEFWGERNDGTLDRALYRVPADQLSDQLSLQTDSSTYFLTVSAGSANLRFSNTANNVAGNTLAPESYFIHSLRNNYSDQIHRGRALVAGGEYIYSSSYDVGEMFSSVDINPANPVTTNFNNIFVAPSGPAATFRAAVAGSAPNGFSSVDRTYKIELNNTIIIDTIVNQFESRINHNNAVPLSLLASNTASFRITNKFSNSTDRIVCSFIELNYPRQFNFGGSSSFKFNLPASATTKYLEITNFNGGSGTPVLYDLTNNRRYVAEVSGTGVVRIVLQPSSTPVQLALVSQSLNITTIDNLQTRTFANYSAPGSQGDYLIISHPSLYANFHGANQVEEYRNYRSSAAGGSYNARVYDIEQLVDQFAFGVKKHPLSIKNFLRYARVTFSQAPKYALLIGHGLTYADYRSYQNNPQAERLNLVPTFGYPASDVVLASNTLEPVMATPIGRISAVTPQEIFIYLEKVKQYEQAQANTVQTIDNKAWMKTVVHVAGANDVSLDVRLTSYLRNYETIIRDTLFGGTVINFNKSSTGPATTIVSSLMEQTFQKGISLLNYFGHSSSSSLDYNLDDPSVYNNTGKYPMFVVNGCNAGNLYAFDTLRFTSINTLSEKYVLAPQKGAIGFIASTHFGLENYLDFYNQGLYRSISTTGYGKGIGININEAVIAMLATYGSTDFGTRLHAEETTLHGDPAVRINSFARPDYAIEEPQINIAPNIISVADNNFTLKTYFYNLGRATRDSVTVEIRRQYPDGSTATLLTKRASIKYMDSVVMVVPINATRDKGDNKIIVTVDGDSRFAELSESNNSATKSFTIYEDELRPVYPYNFAIINKPTVKLVASTANPITKSQTYVLEMDTTELFNSAMKVSKSVTTTGGLIEFDPGVSFMDSIVYYWRVAPTPTAGVYRWNNASFVYLAGSSAGFNQSHFYQHTKSGANRIYIDSSSRKWKFGNAMNNLFITNSIFPTSGNEDSHFSVSVNGITYIESACDGPVLQFNVFDPVTFKPWKNITTNGVGLSGTTASDCKPSRNYNFDFLVGNINQRQRAMRFMDSIPDGFIVVVRNVVSANPAINTYANDWKTDANTLGANNSLYHKLFNQGFNVLDSFNSPRAFAFVYKKNDPVGFTPSAKISDGLGDRITLSVNVNTIDTFGVITSPVFGPAVAWKQVKWRGNSEETTGVDRPYVYVVGITSTGREDSLYRLDQTQQDFDISSISPAQYPYIRLKLANLDSINLTPYQLRYWRILYDAVPEGGLAPNLVAAGKDTLEVGEVLQFNMPFKNVSDVAFRDSIKINMVVTDAANKQTVIPVQLRKRLLPGDTTNISALIDTRAFAGNNTLFIDVNPENAQPEQYHFNNVLYKSFFVKGDAYNPLLDVTFDGVHILNGDIVSSKPKILVKLKDESKFLALDDTALAQVFIQYPGTNGTLRRFAFGTDTLRFIPADLTSGKNEAMIEFTPYFFEDSGNDFYELIVRAKDKNGNSAGNIEYRVRFQVINKPMISNMFNYPNPFTTSTAFVFTLTGSEVPQNIRIQILTVTGKIVKDITKAELGNLHIGRNITEYKWDGTDQYGQKLANGIYLYRVITNQQGKTLEKYNTLDPNGDRVNTDTFFNNGYGKMYLMR